MRLLPRNELVLLAILLLLSLGMHLAVAWRVDYPGYADAFYYFLGAARLARGAGLTEVYGWSYVGQGQLLALPRPAFTYWMPLPAFVAAPFIWLGESLFGRLPTPALFRWGQAPFILAASLWPLLAYAYARHAGASLFRAMAAGVLLLFAGTYLVYSVTPSTVAFYGLFGGLTLFLAGRLHHAPTGAQAALAGACLGLAHLTRSDGVLLWVALLPVLWQAPQRGRLLALAGGAYLMLVGGWWARNLAVIGTPLGDGGLQQIFMRDLVEMWAYPPTVSPANFLAQGAQKILFDRFFVLGGNLTLLALPTYLTTAYLIWAGLKHLREPLFQPVGVYGLTMIAGLSLVFTWASNNGSVFQSGAALAPALAAMAALSGGETTLCRTFRKLWLFLGNTDMRAEGALLGWVVLVTFIAPATIFFSGWENDTANGCAPVHTYIAENTPAETVVMSSIPLNTTYFTGRPALPVPYGDVADLAQAMRDFRAQLAQVDSLRYAPLFAQLESGAGQAEGLCVRDRLDVAACPSLIVAPCAVVGAAK